MIVYERDCSALTDWSKVSNRIMVRQFSESSMGGSLWLSACVHVLIYLCVILNSVFLDNGTDLRVVKV